MKKNINKQIGIIIGATLGQIFFSSIAAQAGQFIHANQISQLFVFGDSMVDDGNLFELTNGQAPPQELGYFQGRYSNGKVFVESLPQELKKKGYGKSTLNYNSANNYAIAGAGTDYNYFLENEMGLDDQINHFLADQSFSSSQSIATTSTVPSIDPDALYLIAAGSNDYLPDEENNFSFDVETVVNNISQSITQLANAGAKNFAITGIADLTLAPSLAGISEEEKEFVQYISMQHNLTLQTALQTLEQQQEIDITFLDLNTILQKSLKNFANTTDACLNLETTSQCSNPNQYLFWDSDHLTSYAHKILAEQSVESYREKNGQGASIPEPQAVFGLLAVTGLSLLLRRKS